VILIRTLVPPLRQPDLLPVERIIRLPVGEVVRQPSADGEILDRAGQVAAADDVVVR